MPPSHLGDFLRRPDVVNNDAELCVLYNNYMQIPVFLETVCPTHKNTQTNTNTWWWCNNMTVCIHYRSLSRRKCGSPRCLVSGRGLSAALRGQRSTLGLTNVSKTTWSSSLRVWSAPTAHTTPPVWPSKSCTSVFYNFLKNVYVLFRWSLFLVFHHVSWFHFVFQCFSSWWTQLHCCRLYEARRVQHHPDLPHLRCVHRITQTYF